MWTCLVREKIFTFQRHFGINSLLFFELYNGPENIPCQASMVAFQARISVRVYSLRNSLRRHSTLRKVHEQPLSVISSQDYPNVVIGCFTSDGSLHAYLTAAKGRTSALYRHRCGVACSWQYHGHPLFSWEAQWCHQRSTGFPFSVNDSVP